MHGMRAFDEHTDNGSVPLGLHPRAPAERSRPRPPRARYGYAETCVLKNHIFGQDYCVMEKPSTKVIDGGYDQL